MRYCFILFCCLIGFINPFTAADLQPCCLDYPNNGDYTGDGTVDFYDLVELSGLWLTCCNQQQFSTLADHWQQEIHHFYEAESAAQQSTFSPFTVQSDPDASGEQYIVAANGVGNNFDAPENSGY